MALQLSAAMLMSSQGINIYEIWEEDTGDVTCANVYAYGDSDLNS